jgi:hypothetical protein
MSRSTQLVFSRERLQGAAPPDERLQDFDDRHGSHVNDWLAPLEAVALSTSAGALVFRTMILRKAAQRALEDEEGWTARLSGGSWLVPVVMASALGALAVSLIRLVFRGTPLGVALAAIVFGLAAIWVAKPAKELDAIARAWMATADPPDPARLGRAEALDRTLAGLGAAAALGAIAHLCWR